MERPFVSRSLSSYSAFIVILSEEKDLCILPVPQTQHRL